MLGAMVPAELAVDTFGHGVAHCRAVFGGYAYRREGKIGLMRDDPPRPRGGRIVEAVAYETAPAEFEAQLDAWRVGRCHVCHLVRSPDEQRRAEAGHKAAGRRLRVREPMFAARLVDLSPAPDRRVARVRDEASLAHVSRWARRRQVPPGGLGADDADYRLYAAWDGARPVGRVRSVAAVPGARWVSDLFVEPSYRRLGLGAALMAAMLLDDQELGYEWSVLAASQAGALLYPRLGYRDAGLLLVFGPRRS